MKRTKLDILVIISLVCLLINFVIIAISTCTNGVYWEYLKYIEGILFIPIVAMLVVFLVKMVTSKR